MAPWFVELVGWLNLGLQANQNHQQQNQRYENWMSTWMCHVDTLALWHTIKWMHCEEVGLAEPAQLVILCALTWLILLVRAFAHIRFRNPQHTSATIQDPAWNKTAAFSYASSDTLPATCTHTWKFRLSLLADLQLGTLCVWIRFHIAISCWPVLLMFRSLNHVDPTQNPNLSSGTMSLLMKSTLKQRWQLTGYKNSSKLSL